VQAHTTYNAFLALAGLSFVAVVGALSVSTYDWTIITGIAILSADMPVLAGFARWEPPDLRQGSPWLDHVANLLWLLSMPGAVLGISFILAHVHFACGILFALSSALAWFLYKRRPDAIKQSQHRQ